VKEITAKTASNFNVVLINKLSLIRGTQGLLTGYNEQSRRVKTQIVLAELVAVMCFFLKAFGKGKDPDLLDLKARIIAIDVNDKILPKSWLPST